VEVHLILSVALFLFFSIVLSSRKFITKVTSKNNNEIGYQKRTPNLSMLQVTQHKILSHMLPMTRIITMSEKLVVYHFEISGQRLSSILRIKQMNMYIRYSRLFRPNQNQELNM
jgi:hypothetical protein